MLRKQKSKNITLNDLGRRIENLEDQIKKLQRRFRQKSPVQYQRELRKEWGKS